MPDEQQGRAEMALAVVLGQVQAGKIRLYQNVLGHPYIVFNVENRPSGCFDLFDDSVPHWLADFIWDVQIGLLHPREIDRILTVLAGRAMQERLARIDDPALLRVV